jgi:hypothetical protein
MMHEKNINFLLFGGEGRGRVKISIFMNHKSIKDSGLAHFGHSNGKFIVQGRIISSSSTLHQFCFVDPLWLNIY